MPAAKAGLPTVDAVVILKTMIVSDSKKTLQERSLIYSSPPDLQLCSEAHLAQCRLQSPRPGGCSASSTRGHTSLAPAQQGSCCSPVPDQADLQGLSLCLLDVVGKLHPEPTAPADEAGGVFAHKRLRWFVCVQGSHG